MISISRKQQLLEKIAKNSTPTAATSSANEYKLGGENETARQGARGVQFKLQSAYNQRKAKIRGQM